MQTCRCNICGAQPRDHIPCRTAGTAHRLTLLCSRARSSRFQSLPCSFSTSSRGLAVPKGLLLGLGGRAGASGCSFGIADSGSSDAGLGVGATMGGSSFGGAVRADRFRRRRSDAPAAGAASAGDVDRLAPHLSPLSLLGAPNELLRSTPRDGLSEEGSTGFLLHLSSSSAFDGPLSAKLVLSSPYLSAKPPVCFLSLSV
jgi:hypothetical protein